MLKKLRIIASTFFLVLSAMFAGLFLRSLHTSDIISTYDNRQKQDSDRAGIIVWSIQRRIMIASRDFGGSMSRVQRMTYSFGRAYPQEGDDTEEPLPGYLWFHFVNLPNRFPTLHFPIWVLSAVSALIAFVLRWKVRFSLKLFLVVITLYAVCLGLGTIKQDASQMNKWVIFLK